jgi:uncharacterized membrane protein (DUF4010 family)
METLAPYSLYVGLGLACLSGLLIGFEREQSSPERLQRGEAPLGGVRTHPLVSLLGGVGMLLARELGIAGFVATFAAVLVLLAISYAADVRAGSHGLTSEAALLLSFLLGALSTSEVLVPDLANRVLLVLSITVVATLLLSIKMPLHAFVASVSREDIFASLKFLLVSVVVLPLLPNQTYGPLSVLNPRNIGIMVVLIAGVSFVGYVALRVRGPQGGLALTGLVGGLVSSTAVTLAFSGRARANPSLASACALAVMLANTVMYARVLVLVAVVDPSLVTSVVAPLGACVVASVVVSLWVRRRSQAPGAPAQVAFTNPFELGSAVKFALIYALVLLVSKAATQYLGTGGTYLAGVLAGTTDVDAITISVAHMSVEGMDHAVAATTILLAISTNTLVKAGMAVVMGGWAFGRQVLAGFLAVLAAGGAGLAATWLM